ncbi:hypothetical protein I9H06_16555 [Pseudomonas tremae]|uniref:hypothetical protein n=1 Tax=Pseudomonas tremae TaxID=200454 RepID=UPI001F448FF9|nr:hypothetical protein [Pseudomonas tremae]MCF5714291.1 hypothetical protein [Pseudomonas tremae]UQB29977.1 hypothetical protein I9H06_16555 [Pseudomonas tremae]
MSIHQIESALSAVPGHPNKTLALGIAEGLTIAFFTSQKIDAEQFKCICRRIRTMGEQIKQVPQ